jgi:hypothetical protein
MVTSNINGIFTNGEIYPSISSPYTTTITTAANTLISNWDIVDRDFLKSDNINTKDIELRINVKKHKLKLNFEL